MAQELDELERKGIPDVVKVLLESKAQHADIGVLRIDRHVWRIELVWSGDADRSDAR